MKTYTLKTMNVTTNPEAVVQVEFMGGKLFHGALGDLTDWAKTNCVDTPRRCATEAGRHGLYPVLMAETEQMALAISILRGFKVEVGDGVTFASRSQLRGAYSAMVKAGVEIPHASVMWGITELPYANSVAKPVERQLSLEEQLADSPFA
jgi:hypothetical protein